ncbi:hypothetical protein JCGZ_03536 [Jatropha curcas]|uniref:BZIP domain-containing protein n=1 Tax=Jatropha curcas TaxID=180498 RepID=A0A067L0U0_JATCU|nr:G-box-binding factor 4 [Jatropha curcas]KDP42047.1 hypothetical protein JCGZ_03536 [Jatropha curcas]
MATTSSTNSDMPRQPSLCSSLSTLLADLQNQNQDQNQFTTTEQNPLVSTAMDDLLKNIYSYPCDDHSPLPGCASKSVDEVWKEIVSGSDQKREGNEGITLEDFLTKAGAVSEEDVKGVGVPAQMEMSVGPYSVDINNHGMIMAEGGGRGRQKRRAVEEPPMDKATQQKQKRMIKNRESAARSRERKQAHTIELESLVRELEEENTRLLKEEVEKNKERYKGLMKNLIPVVEKRRPPRVLRRVNSVRW